MKIVVQEYTMYGIYPLILDMNDVKKIYDTFDHTLYDDRICIMKDGTIHHLVDSCFEIQEKMINALNNGTA